MKKSVKWVLVVLIIGVLTSFIEKNRLTYGLEVGDLAPDFCFRSADAERDIDLSDLRGHRVLISFWASYDATSRMQNIGLSRAVDRNTNDSLLWVSVSFDEYNSVFSETVSRDGITPYVCFAETEGTQSALYSKYDLRKGFGNYLLDERGVIVAKNVRPSELTAYKN